MQWSDEAIKTAQNAYNRYMEAQVGMPIEEAAQQAVSTDPYAGDETPVGTRDVKHPDNVQSYMRNAALQNKPVDPLAKLPFDVQALLTAQDAYVTGLTAFVHGRDTDELCQVQENFIDAQRVALKQLGIL